MGTQPPLDVVEGGPRGGHFSVPSQGHLCTAAGMKQPVQEISLLSRETSQGHPDKDGGGGGRGVCMQCLLTIKMYQTAHHVGSGYTTVP